MKVNKMTNEEKRENRDVKNESDVNVDQEEDEVMILKRNKTTHVSL